MNHGDPVFRNPGLDQHGPSKMRHGNQPRRVGERASETKADGLATRRSPGTGSLIDPPEAGMPVPRRAIPQRGDPVANRRSPRRA